MSAAQVTSPRSASSLKLGLASLLCVFFTGLPAVIQGIRGLREIHRRPYEFKGRGTALLGITTGVIGSVAGVFLVMYLLEYVQDASDRMH